MEVKDYQLREKKAQEKWRNRRKPYKCSHCNFKTDHLNYLLNVHKPKQHGIKRGFKNQLEVLP